MEIQERNDTFKSLEAPSEGLYKEKGSKFLAFAYPVTSEEEIKQHLERSGYGKNITTRGITAMRTGSGLRAMCGG